MRQFWFVVMTVGAGLWRPPAASADDAMTFSLEDVQVAAERASEAARDGVDRALGEVRWEMSKADVLQLVKADIRRELADQVRRELDVIRQDALVAEAKQRYAAVKRGFIAFDGRKTGWDASPMASEFRHGSDESMLVVDTAAAREHYFFIAGKLWKWYRELKAGSERADVETVASELQADLGEPQRQARQLDEDTVVPALTWRSERTQLSVFRRGAEVCVVFEDRAALASLSTLRRNAEAREKKANPVLESLVMTPAEREAWRRRQK